MVKRILAIAILCGITTVNASYTSFWPDLTTQANGTCFEDSHIGANDCARVFASNLTNWTYWQNDSSAGHYFGFNFNSFKKIAKYTVINVNNDPTLLMKSWRFQAETGTGWLTLDTQSGFTIQYGNRYEFEILDPVEAKRFRVLIDVAWIDGVLVTDVTMHEWTEKIGDLTVNYADADAEKAKELIISYNTAFLVFVIIFWILYVWKQALR